jgi:hypothetical protein
VVFHDRLADLNSEIVGERIVDVAFQTSGATGGEVLLHWTPPNAALNTPEEAEKALALRANDWIVLSGVERNPITGGLVPRFQWYRVTHCDQEPTYNGSPSAAFSGAGYELYASLTGQDWNVSLINPRSAAAIALPPTVNGTACATLLTGVVGVYEKTVRLEYGDSL